MKALLDLLYSREAELREEKKQSFVKLSTDIKLFEVTHGAWRSKIKRKNQIFANIRTEDFARMRSVLLFITRKNVKNFSGVKTARKNFVPKDT